jgi:hypothetical protein
MCVSFEIDYALHWEIALNRFVQSISFQCKTVEIASIFNNNNGYHRNALAFTTSVLISNVEKSSPFIALYTYRKVKLKNVLRKRITSIIILYIGRTS